MAFEEGSVVSRAARAERDRYTHERITAIEVQQARQDERIKQIEGRHDELMHRVDSRVGSIDATVSAMRDEFTRFKGMVGGVMLALSLAGALVAVMRQQIAAAVVRLFK